jgi:ribosomal protein L13E
VDAARARAQKRTWMAERGYRVLEASAAGLTVDLARTLDLLAAQIASATSP